MIVNKAYELFEVEIVQGKRVLAYNCKNWVVTYLYNDKLISNNNLTVDRYFKALSKYHYLEYAPECLRPHIHIETERGVK